MVEEKKIRIMRVVTSSECVPWHLGNTIKRMANDFEVSVVGQGVSQYSDAFQKINWFDLDIDRKINPLADVRSLYKLIRIILRVRPDIIHSIMPKAGLLTALAGFICRVPIRVHTFTGQVWTTQTGFFRFILLFMDKLISKLNTVCLTDSASQSFFLFDHNIRYSGKSLPVLLKGSLSGYDTEKINNQAIGARAETLRNTLKIDKSDFIFTFIARKSRDKGAIDLINAFSIISNNYPKAKLLFVGPDETRGEIRKMEKSRPDLFKKIINVGRVDNHELYLAISHVLCLPSYREGFGTIVIDAAALGIPTIGSKIVGLVDSIEDGKTGILFPAGDLNKLSQAMLFMLKNPEQRNQMGQSAKQRVEAYFTADQLYIALKEFYFQHAYECSSNMSA